jgi:cobalt-zinc-cadmium efflux system protein
MDQSTTKRLFWSLIVTVFIFAGEVIGGILSNSLALLSDAGHVLTDAFALGLSLAAVMVMRRPSDYRATYGYQRIGILAALINGVSLVVIAMFIFAEGYKRLQSPPEIHSGVMLGVAVAGLIGNLVMAWILGHKHDDLNMKSAWLHVLGDTVSSVGVIVAGLVIRYTGWLLADPIVSGLVGLIIIIGGVRVIKETLTIFLELSPVGFHAGDISSEIATIPGIMNVHDVHVWSIGHGIPAFSAHVQVHDQKIGEADGIRQEIEHRLSHLGIRHSVIQMECDCEDNAFYCRIDAEDGASCKHNH